ncbi:MAG: hypothetical protein LBT05_10995 [Planctomycetaceae bacterium]|nr:hypothetical protein [Planctomycetaceae bacterium]
MQTLISKNSILLMLLIFMNTQTWTPGQEKSTILPEKREEYQKLVSEYRDLTKRHKKLLETTRKSDPGFQRAMDWLDHERLEVSTPFAKEDREFFSQLQNNEDKKFYRDWQRSVAAKIHMEVFEKEWKKHPGSHQPLLFWAGMMMKRFSMDQNSEAENLPIPEMKGSEESQWSEFLNYAKRLESQKIEKIPHIVEKLRIPKNLIDHFEIRVANTALFNVYDTYYRLHYPEEVTKLEKEQTKVHNQLMAINPNWVYDEKLEFRNDEEYKRFQLAPVARSPFLGFL